MCTESLKITVKPLRNGTLNVSLEMSGSDVRYLTIKPMLKEGRIKIFKDIFLFQKRTVMAKDIGKRIPRFAKLIDRPENFTIREAAMMAELCHIDYLEMMQLIKAQMGSPKKKIPKPKKDLPETDLSS